MQVKTVVNNDTIKRQRSACACRMSCRSDQSRRDVARGPYANYIVLYRHSLAVNRFYRATNKQIHIKSVKVINIIAFKTVSVPHLNAYLCTYQQQRVQIGPYYFMVIVLISVVIKVAGSVAMNTQNRSQYLKLFMIMSLTTNGKRFKLISKLMLEFILLI